MEPWRDVDAHNRGVEAQMKLCRVWSSVPDPWNFGVDPDPRIHASD